MARMEMDYNMDKLENREAHVCQFCPDSIESVGEKCMLQHGRPQKILSSS